MSGFFLAMIPCSRARRLISPRISLTRSASFTLFFMVSSPIFLVPGQARRCFPVNSARAAAYAQTAVARAEGRKAE